LTLAGTSDVAVSGNLFSGVGPTAVAVEAESSRRVLFSGNVLTDGASEDVRLRDSLVGENLRAASSK